MKFGNDIKHFKRINWTGIRKILLCALTILMAICVATVTALTVKTLTMSPREQIKVRLMRLIERYGWDPYSANMTIDEFYALMELFDEGKLPLKKQATAYADDSEGENNGNAGSAQNLIIPREKFFLVGLPNDLAAKEDTVIDDDGVEKEILDQPLVYDHNNNYEPYDPYTGAAYKVGENDGEYILNDITYKLHEDGRLYNEDAFENYRAFDHGFIKSGAVYEMKDGNLYVLGTEDEYVCLFRKRETDGTYKIYMLDVDGKLYEYNVASKTKGAAYEYGSADSELHLFEKDSVVYFLNTTNSKLYVYDKDKESQDGIEFVDVFKSFSGVDYELRGGTLYRTRTDNEMPFNEPAGEYYCYFDGANYHAYEWRNGVMCFAGTSIAANSQVIKNLSHRYPSGYGLPGAGYMRPPKDWEGVKVEDSGDVQTVLVKKGINDNRYDIASDVDQSVFQGDEKADGGYEHGILYKNYYIKQITIEGANVNILGIIRVPETGKLVYYYLSAEEQDWQVSTTTLREEDKFLIEYTPNEYKIEYQVLNNVDVTPGTDLTSEAIRAKSIANEMPKNVVMYGSNTATTASWVDSIFGTTASRPARTTGGAYSFDVRVPYGYEVQIFISVDRTISGTFVRYNSSTGEYEDIPDIAQYPNATGAIPYTFHVDIDHTSSRQKVEDTWLKGYSEYLKTNKIIAENANFDNLYTRGTEDGRYVYTWNDENDPNVDVHNGVLAIMAERINDIQMHNSARSYDDHDNSQTGFPLGKEPEYSYYPGDGFSVFADEKGPASLTMNDTFYNHLVKANRMITAVLTKHDEPKFDVSKVLSNSKGASNRGSSATERFAELSIQPYTKLKDFDGDYYDADYLWHSEPDHGGLTEQEHPINFHHSTYANVENDGNWGWPKEDATFKGHAMGMKPSGRDGTYYYSYVFQTNDSDTYTLDALEVNGRPVLVPYFPKYKWQNGTQTAEEVNRPYFTETTLQDGSVFTVEFLMVFGGKNQRVYRFTVRGARTNVSVTGLNLMTGNGAPEFSIYSLTGIYDGVGNQTDSAIQYYDYTQVWKTGNQANVVVIEDKKGGIRNEGDKDKYGANLRFKIADGYGNPYYMWTDIKDVPVKNQTSLPYKKDENGNPTTNVDTGHPNEIINLSKVKAEPEKWTDSDNRLLSQYIFYQDDPNLDDYGYYYIHVEEPDKTNRICLLTIVAKTVKYTVRYTSSYDPDNSQTFNPKTQTAWYGFIQDRSTGKLINADGDLQYMRYMQKAPNDKQFQLDAKSMPETIHDRETCELVNMIDPDDRENWWDILHQYDDNGGNFYDMIYNAKASIASNSYGTIRPKDVNNGYSFVAWVLVNEKFEPYLDENEDPIYFNSGIIDLNIYADYAVKHSAFGTNDVDLHVFRLMPVWKANNNPYSYNVVLNWVDAKGTLNQMEFKDWDDVVTEAQDGEQLFVFLNKDSIPLKNWIASHPTYIFWDAVNNATTKFITDDNGNLILDDNGNPQRDRKANTQILKEALEEYLQREYNPKQYPQDALILQALVNRDYTGFNEKGEQTKAGSWKADALGSYIVDPFTEKTIWVPYKYVPGGNGVDDFDRLDGNIFRVNENGGTISIWMYETKGGLIFKKEVEVEPFTGDDEFYFSIINNWVGEKAPDEGSEIPRLGTVEEPAVYKAYPLTEYNKEEGTWGFYDKKSGKFTPVTDEDSWLVTFVNGEIVSIEQHGELLVERDGDGEPILDKYGNEIPVTYFTLVHDQGIALYVPNGNYTVVETGSKSGGSYQAEVDYKDGSGNVISGSVELPTGKDENGNDVELWMKGTKKQYIRLEDGEKFDEGKYAGISQIPVTVTFKTGEKELIQTLTFHNRTNSLSVKMTLHQNVYDKYPTNGTQAAKDSWDVKYNGDYAFSVVFALPDGQTPLVQGVTSYANARAVTDGYYFKMNVYSVLDSNKKTFVRTVDVPFVNYNPEYDEVNNPNPDRNPWGIVTDDYKNLWIGKFTLNPGEQGALVMQVMTGSVNYWVDEPGKTDENNSKLSNDLTPTWKTSKYGTANVGMENSAWVENYYGEPTPSDFGYLKITVEGGKPTESFLFRITGRADDGLTSVDIIVSVKGGGNSTYIYILYGTYKVEEIGWAWRYNVTAAITTTVGTPHTEYKDAQEITFNASPGKGWLGGESSIDKWLS